MCVVVCVCVFILVLNTRNVVETNDTSNFLFGGVVLPFVLNYFLKVNKTHDMEKVKL